MKKLQKISLILFLLIFSIQGWSAEKIALTLKARGQTSLKRSNEETFKTGVKPGTSLFSEDQIKTGDDGYAVLVFLDDKTQIKIRENSEMVISGTRTTESISKQIAMQVGTLKAEISPQRKGEFVIATPTSVASVKGTVFWLTSDPVMGDVFYGMSGSVEVTNNESGAVVVVGANETGTSTPDGQVSVETTPQGVAPADDDEDDADTSNILRIQLQNNQGDIKDIKIEY
ncbi:FecR family protein [bacterium]|nr:FecR family protein [bacterium]MBU1063750.1 FecR family protein [bacterium]MBU1632995.1 FecR family protein [bacterium]MBU1873034.1 FecR family protein [bacterium]